jgi:hypothetical protein
MFIKMEIIPINSISVHQLQALIAEILKKDKSIVVDALDTIISKSAVTKGNKAKSLKKTLQFNAELGAGSPFDAELILQKHRITAEAVAELQELWKDAPSVEEFLMFDDKHFFNNELPS